MLKSIVRQVDYDLTQVAGLVMVGRYPTGVSPVLDRLDTASPMRTGVRISDACRVDLGLLTHGKSDGQQTR